MVMQCLALKRRSRTETVGAFPSTRRDFSNKEFFHFRQTHASSPAHHFQKIRCPAKRVGPPILGLVGWEELVPSLVLEARSDWYHFRFVDAVGV